MTCIVGLIDDGVTWIGGDSAGVSSQTTFRGKTKKVFRQGPYVIGFAGSYNLAQTIRGLDLPEPPPMAADAAGISHFMEVKFSTFLKDQVYSDEEEASLLVGIKGQLFELDAHFGVFEGEFSFNAIGSAAEFALGALMGFTSWGMVRSHVFDGIGNGADVVMAALEVAHALSPGNCQPPYTILHTGPVL